MGQGYGFGKVILFGEHFVVHGVPSIASAISSKTTAIVEKKGGTGIEVVDERPEIPGYKKEKLEMQEDSDKRILEAVGINTDETGVKITLGGDLMAASGVGASAASCAAIARALSEEFSLGFDDEKINQIAYEGEKGYHGSPSGIDNTAATFGGLIWFIKGDPNIIEKMKIEKPLYIVMGNTGIVANTKAAVEGVKERKEKEPDKYNKIFEDAKNLIHDARKALEAGDVEKVGKLMDENHRLLQEIEVSSPELDMLVSLAKENGALGAKMTGGGLGGYMYALAPDQDIQERIAKVMGDKQFQVIKATVGG
ncbi:MAG: mevalonate kinase [Nanoarchaeota archaeon]|nr:mevalonate kinase [Nanoarchaeota archaeon]